jgi:hypothetical protein
MSTILAMPERSGWPRDLDLCGTKALERGAWLGRDQCAKVGPHDADGDFVVEFRAASLEDYSVVRD